MRQELSPTTKPQFYYCVCRWTRAIILSCQGADYPGVRLGVVIRQAHEGIESWITCGTTCGVRAPAFIVLYLQVRISACLGWHPVPLRSYMSRSTTLSQHSYSCGVESSEAMRAADSTHLSSGREVGAMKGPVSDVGQIATHGALSFLFTLSGWHSGGSKLQTLLDLAQSQDAQTGSKSNDTQPEEEDDGCK